MPVVNYLWNPLNDNIVREFDDAGTVIAEYTTEANQFGNVISQRRSGQDSVYHYDGQGSTLALTNANGDVTDTYAYSAFGEVTAHTGSTANPFQYIGQKQYYYDNASGTFSVRRRDYDPFLGQWLSPDPTGLALAFGAESLERQLVDELIVFKRLILAPYLYCSLQPVYLIDPSGEYPECKDIEATGECRQFSTSVQKPPGTPEERSKTGRRPGAPPQVWVPCPQGEHIIDIRWHGVIIRDGKTIGPGFDEVEKCMWCSVRGEDCKSQRCSICVTLIKHSIRLIDGTLFAVQDRHHKCVCCKGLRPNPRSK